jgi:hypothetical protein
MSNNPPSIGTGYFSKIDSIHVHVDGGGEPGPVEHIVEQLEKQGLLGKITPIKEAIPGPQREESWAVGTYESHTPGLNGQEHMDEINLKEAVLTAADLRRARLRGAKLEYADLQGADLRGADFTNANISNVTWKGAIYDVETRFPYDFDKSEMVLVQSRPKLL